MSMSFIFILLTHLEKRSVFSLFCFIRRFYQIIRFITSHIFIAISKSDKYAHAIDLLINFLQLNESFKK